MTVIIMGWHSASMLTALDSPTEALDPDEQAFVTMVREHGWFCTGVSGDGERPGFSYSTGFWIKTQRPEVIMFSMKNEVAHQIFWDLFRDAEAGTVLPEGKRTDVVFGNAPAYAFAVAKRHYAGYLGWSRWFHAGDDFPCLQIVWPDRAGLFPWEAGADPAFAESQPDLSEKGWLAEIRD